MTGLLQQVGPEIILVVALLALMGLRARVKPKASLLVKAPPSRLWDLLNPYDGKVDRFGRATMTARLIDAAPEIYQVTWDAALPGGSSRTFTAQFRVSERIAERKLVLTRMGLEGKSDRNELLEIRHELALEGDGTRLKTAYLWGSRALLAQLLARADLWGGTYRLKGLAETGKPNERPHWLIGLGIAAVTGFCTLMAFGYLFGGPLAAVLVLALLVHEFGHLLAFRMIGQPWGRLLFLPFLGAIAVPRMPYETQAQSVFAALMGPGFSCLMLFACIAAQSFNPPLAKLFAIIGDVTAFLNLFNLLPVEPLDGGIALRSVLSRLMGARATLVLLGLGVLMAVAGYFTQQLVLVVFGGFAILGNLKARKIDAGLTPLTSLQVSIFFFGYVAIVATHYTMLYRFIDLIQL